MYLKTTNLENYWAIDIEGDGLPSTVVWCACAVNISTGEEVSLIGKEEIEQWINNLNNDKNNRPVFIGHNIIGYDAPTLNRLCNTMLVMSQLVDTMLLSMVYSPSLNGGHSLESWGNRLKYKKGEFNDFSKYSVEMLQYCMRDAKLCAAIFKALVKRMRSTGFTDKGLKLEHESWQLIQQQKKNGFAFDIVAANVLYAELREIEHNIQTEIYTYWPPTLEVVKTCKNPYKKNGKPSANFLRHQSEYETVSVSKDKTQYFCHDYVAFNIGSPVQRVDKLEELGWVARERTPTGNAKPTNKGKLSPSLVEFVETSGRKEPKLICDWLEINSRANMINTWIEAYNDTTKCIHGSLWYANTLRYRHSNPNTANIPAVRLDDSGKPIKGQTGSYTYEARDLWGVRSDDRLLVGTDAKGIQLRVLAHYLNNPDFTEAVLDGDPHSYNQRIGDFESRPVAKTFIYAFLLGAGDAKVGEIIGGSTRDGREIKQRFINNFPGLGQLLDSLETQINKTGRITLCDGTPLLVTAPHTRLGYLLQGDESRIMKQAAILTAKEIRRRRLDVLKVGDIHDEWQNDVLAAHVDEFVTDVAPTAFRSSGSYFNYRLPIACDSKVGRTWASTH